MGHAFCNLLAGGNFVPLSKNASGQIVVALAHLLQGFGQKGAASVGVFLQHASVDGPRAVPLAGAHKGGCRLREVIFVARHVALALPGGGHAKLGLALNKRAAHGSLKGIDGAVPLALLKALHAHAKVVFGLADGLEQNTVCGKGIVKSLGAGELACLVQIVKRWACGNQKIEVGFELVYGVRARQKGAGAAAKCAKLFHFTVVRQYEQHGHVEQHGVQAQNGAKLLAFHV